MSRRDALAVNRTSKYLLPTSDFLSSSTPGIVRVNVKDKDQSVFFYSPFHSALIIDFEDIGHIEASSQATLCFVVERVILGSLDKAHVMVEIVGVMKPYKVINTVSSVRLTAQVRACERNARFALNP